MTPLLGMLAMSALIAWLVRQPSAELFEEANSHYATFELWDRRIDELCAGGRPEEWLSRLRVQAGIVDAAWRRNVSLDKAHALTRKALRRMPWRLM